MKKSTAIAIVVFVLSSLFCLNTFADESERQATMSNEITWFYADFPPVTVPSGNHAGLGFFDQVNKVLAEEMVEYNHSFVLANYQRIIHELEKQQNSCCVALYKTDERAKFIEFSVPAVVVLPNGIVIKKSNQKKFEKHFDSDGKLSLRSVLEDKSIKIGLAKGRKYSGGLDEVLSKYQNQKNILYRPGTDVFKGLLDMLFAGRVDCIIGYPVEAEYLAKEAGLSGLIQFYPVAEVDKSYTVGQVGCPKNEWGKKVISAVDKILLERRESDRFLSFYEYWLDEETKKSYQTIAKEAFASEAKK